MPKKLSPASTGELLDSWGRTRNRKLSNIACQQCGKVFRPPKKSSKYCGRTCQWQNNGRKRADTPTWWTNTRGYVCSHFWVNNKQVEIKQHRYIMEQHIGRSLLADENVHHINGIKNDNRIENLEIIAHGEHVREHNLKRTYKRGYKLNLTNAQRAEKSARMSLMRRAAIKKAEKK